MFVVFSAEKRLADAELMGCHCPLVEWAERKELVEVLEIAYVDLVGADADDWT